MIVFKAITYFNHDLNDLCFFEESAKKTKRLVSALDPSTKQSGPVDLFCLSWAVCFYKTSKKILEEQGYLHNSVKVKVILETKKDEQGFCWHPTAIVGISKMTLEQTQIIIDDTHKRCPVSRLISASPYVKVQALNYDDLIIR